ncbi:Cutaneous T-cell lymphoma-associated antigen 5 [Tupaia chinensis]|uniref:Cutaneous T-cell lymphoma-associated antigen 5 n=1 Tax=Tupaia chinensis TaxID=246437 RepID=L9KYW8_TUPCH|nr:Cutaneous T-cell lymphoma-associated antigen 5 [Tupaia chinensis]
MTKNLRQGLGSPEFPWVALVCVAVVVLIVKRRHSFRRGKELSKKCTVHQEVHRQGLQHNGPVTQAEEALGSVLVEARPPTLQSLCLLILSNNLRLSLQDAADFLERARKTKCPKSSHVTDTGHILKRSKEEKERLQMKAEDGLNKNTHFEKSPDVLGQEIVRWKQRAQERKEEERLDVLNAQMKQLMKDFPNQLKPMAGITIPLPDFLGNPGNSEVELKREIENADHPDCGSEVDLKSIADEQNLSVPRRSQEKQDKRQVWEETLMKEELTGQILSLHTEHVFLQFENSQLDSEIENLQMKLQILSKLHQEQVTQLQRRFTEEENRCLEVEKKLCSVFADMNFTYQILNLHKKMAQDMEKELGTTVSFCQEEICFYEKRAEESRMAVVLAERNLDELTEENEHNRMILADMEFRLQSFSRHPFVPAASHAAHRGQKYLGFPGSSGGQGGGYTVRAQHPKIPCRFDSGLMAVGPEPHRQAGHLSVLPL